MTTCAMTTPISDSIDSTNIIIHIEKQYKRLRYQVTYMVRDETKEGPLIYEDAKLIINKMNTLLRSHPFLLQWEASRKHPFLHECMQQMSLSNCRHIEWYKTYVYAYECLHDLFASMVDHCGYGNPPLARLVQTCGRWTYKSYQTNTTFQTLMETRVDITQESIPISNPVAKQITIREWMTAIVNRYYLFYDYFRNQSTILPFGSDNCPAKYGGAGTGGADSCVNADACVDVCAVSECAKYLLDCGEKDVFQPIREWLNKISNE